jgi:hypothetical protein
MTPKEKAEILRSKMFFSRSSIESASIAVDEILDIAYWEYMESMGEKEKEYWQQVKQEIINL